MNIKVFSLRNSNKKVYRLPSTSSQISRSLGIYTESRKIKTLHIFTYFERLFSSMTHLKKRICSFFPLTRYVARYILVVCLYHHKIYNITTLFPPKSFFCPYLQQSGFMDRNDRGIINSAILAY